MLNITFSRVRDGQLELLRAWGRELEGRRDEVRETFRQEGVKTERSFLLETTDGWVHVIAIEVEDMDGARAAYDSSTLPIDLQHRATMAAALDGPFPVEHLYECAL
jgi:hypothetical protein